jgi:phosphohistidine phosphatase
MLLYLMRHAHAESGGEDLQRPLSAAGREHIQRLLPLLRLLQVEPDWILSSPYQRAFQTAQLVAEGLGYSREIIVDSALTPAGSTIGVQAVVLAFAQSQQLLLVGHAPSISNWLGELCGARQFRFRFPAGAIGCIELPDPRRWAGTLCWLIGTDQLHGA